MTAELLLVNARISHLKNVINGKRVVIIVHNTKNTPYRFVTFDTGESLETIDATVGVVVPVDDMRKLKLAIVDLCHSRSNNQCQRCISRVKMFDPNYAYQKYILLYEMCMRLI